LPAFSSVSSSSSSNTTGCSQVAGIW
jgi:hypothetical protein